MKTIRITFSKDAALIASVTGQFATVPGTGPLQWENKQDLEAILAPPYAAPLPDIHYADLFQDAMVALAGAHNLQAEITTDGDWSVHEE